MTSQSARTLAAIFAGGALGAIARAEVAEALPVRPGTFPWATFIVNIAGAALLGWFATWLQARRPPTRHLRPFLTTGLCGGLTTFSTMQVELLRLLDRGDVGLALGYAVASVTAGLAAVQLTTTMVERAAAR
jgi:CrcB protein